MAKRSRAKTNGSARLPFQTPPRRVRAQIKHPLKRRLATTTPLTVIQDNRQWHPSRAFRPALQIIKRGAARINPLRLAQPVRTQIRRLSEPLQFSNPRRVLVCIRRKARSRVLHALKVAGSGGLKKPRRNQWSDVKC